MQLRLSRPFPIDGQYVRRIAKVLGEDADLWIAFADRVPEDVDGMVKRHPNDMPELMRLVNRSAPWEFHANKEAVRKIRKLIAAKPTFKPTLWHAEAHHSCAPLK